MQLQKILTSPTAALTTFTGWIFIFIMLLGFMGAFSDKFLHFGPSTDPDTQANFLGKAVDSWEMVILLYILGFLSAVFSTYYHSVFGAWLTNAVRDPKQKNLGMNQTLAYILITLDPIVASTNRILELFVTLTLQLQFLIPQLLGEIISTIFISRSFLSEKTGSRNKRKK
jgi:hypothetical protein